MRQAYLLGRELHRRYVSLKKLLKPVYDPQEVYWKSSSLSRCYMTTNAKILGMFDQGSGLRMDAMPYKPKKSTLPPFKVTNADKLIEELGDFALPLGLPLITVATTRDASKDLFFHAHKPGTCPHIATLLSDLEKSDEYKAKTLHFRETIAYELADIINQDRDKDRLIPDQLDILKLKQIYDSYKSFTFHKKKVPTITPELLKKLNELQLYYVYKFKYGNDTIRKMTNSYLFEEFHNLLASKAADLAIPLKYASYAAHDSNLFSLLRSFLNFGNVILSRNDLIVH
jgi:hypothetical protein